MKTKGYRSGVALITVLVLTGVVTIVLGGVLGYVSSASRMSAYYENKNLCRLAAQSEIELAKAAIDHQFANRDWIINPGHVHTLRRNRNPSRFPVPWDAPGAAAGRPTSDRSLLLRTQMERLIAFPSHSIGWIGEQTSTPSGQMQRRNPSGASGPRTAPTSARSRRGAWSCPSLRKRH